MKLNLSSQIEAVETVENILRTSSYTNLMKIPLNDNRHYFISVKNPINRVYEGFYVKWEKELFHTAAQKWDELRERTIRGACTLNVEAIKKVLELNARQHTTILFCSNEDGLIYEISAIAFNEAATEQARKQDLTNEWERCIAVDDLKPWRLLPAGMGEMVWIIQCDTCGYKKVQSKQDVNLTELLDCKLGHEMTFGHLGHNVTAYQTTKFDSIALKLRDNLNRWERW